MTASMVIYSFRCDYGVACLGRPSKSINDHQRSWDFAEWRSVVTSVICWHLAESGNRVNVKDGFWIVYCVPTSTIKVVEALIIRLLNPCQSYMCHDRIDKLTPKFIPPVSCVTECDLSVRQARTLSDASPIDPKLEQQWISVKTVLLYYSDKLQLIMFYRPYVKTATWDHNYRPSVRHNSDQLTVRYCEW